MIRQRLRGSAPAFQRQQRKAIVERFEPYPPAIQHLAPPGVRAQAEQLGVDIQGDVIAATQFVTVLRGVQILRRIVQALMLSGSRGTTIRPLP